MVIKGKSRTNGPQLAAYLQKLDGNERVEILEHISRHDALADTFRDWEVLAQGVQGKKYLYHAQINPEARYAMTPEQWERAADVLEKELGFTGQPRLIVFHQKDDGRQHAHVVWHRIDMDKMTLIDDSWNYLANERASLALEKEFGHEIVPGKHAKRDREKQPEFPRSELAEHDRHIAERTGMDPQELKETLTRLYHQSDNGPALKSALAEQGFILATGDQRGFVIVDREGEVYSLSRQLLDVKAKDMRERLRDIGQLPNVDEAKALREAERLLKQQPPTPTPEPTKPEPDNLTQPQPHTIAPEELAKLEAALKDRHEKEEYWMLERQKAERRQINEVFKQDRNEKLKDRRALRNAELERFTRKGEEYSDNWIRKFIDIIKHRWNPAAAYQQRLERQRQIDEIRTRHRIERDTIIQTLKIQRDQDVADLKDRHAQQQREHADRYKTDLQRYTREHAAAQRLLAQIEAERRKEELERKPDEPDPPKPSL